MNLEDYVNYVNIHNFQLTTLLSYLVNYLVIYYSNIIKYYYNLI